MESNLYHVMFVQVKHLGAGELEPKSRKVWAENAAEAVHKVKHRAGPQWNHLTEVYILKAGGAA